MHRGSRPHPGRGEDADLLDVVAVLQVATVLMVRHDELHKNVGGILNGGRDQREGLLLRLEGGAGGEILAARVAAVTCCRFGQLDGAASGLCLGEKGDAFFRQNGFLENSGHYGTSCQRMMVCELAAAAAGALCTEMAFNSTLLKLLRIRTVRLSTKTPR